MQALIADIRRLTIHDGPGTRDTVFVKGCPLHCLWCHNPESISPKPQLIFRQRLCIGCGECTAVCPQNVHSFADGSHLLDRTRCIACGKCAEACLPGAVTLCGKSMTPQQVFDAVVSDRTFFDESDGGVTVSGGEPLIYPDFTAELFRLLKQTGIHTALDTCGAVDFAAFEKVLPFTDRILFDVKGMDPVRHTQNTGLDNKQILENLSRLGTGNIPVEIRMPIIPGYNDDPEEIKQAGLFLSGLPAVCLIKILAYHSMARDKYTMCGRPDTMPQAETPSEERMAQLAASLQETSDKKVVF